MLEDEEELVIELEGLSTNETKSDLCLVGKFLTEQSINLNVAKGRLAGIWKPRRGVSIRDIGSGRLLIQFYHILDLKRVVEGGPWSIANHPLLVHRLKVGEIPDQVPLNKIIFWVQIHKLPYGTFLESVGKSLGNYIGKFLEYDTTNKVSPWMKFMRIRVELDVDKPLKKGRKIKVGGTSAEVVFKYERLHIFCYICGKLGHSD